MTRSFTPYDQTQLSRHGFDSSAIASLAAEVPQDIPIEYITGWAPFCEMELRVSPATLIPREESEGVIARAMHSAQQIAAARQRGTPRAPLRFIDVGTGSGALGICFQRALIQRSIVSYGILSDTSPAALAIAAENIRRHRQRRQRDHSYITQRHSDLLQDISLQADIIMANLPYLPQKTMQSLDTSVSRYEPATALSGGADGLELIGELLHQARQQLAPDGILLLEIDASHTPARMQRLSQAYGWHCHVERDHYQRWRYATLRPALL